MSFNGVLNLVGDVAEEVDTRKLLKEIYCANLGLAISVNVFEEQANAFIGVVLEA